MAASRATSASTVCSRSSYSSCNDAEEVPVPVPAIDADEDEDDDDEDDDDDDEDDGFVVTAGLDQQVFFWTARGGFVGKFGPFIWEVDGLFSC
jgi:hypothetical protein